MSDSPENLCPRPQPIPPMSVEPLAAPIWPASVWRCDNPEQARQLLAGELPGYVYQRDGHPNADLLAEKCRLLHGAEAAAVTSTGMSALALVLLSQLEAGQRLVVSDQLYGRSIELLTDQARRLNVEPIVVDTCDLEAVAAALVDGARLLVVETITNPLLRVSNLSKLADMAHAAGALLVVDNTFASPAVCRPLEHGADLVVESLSKSMNGHSDVMLGLLCGSRNHWDSVPAMQSIWGLSSSPIDCWLAARGLTTLAVRAAAACDSALAVAEMLASHRAVKSVSYPGLAGHVDHELTTRLFQSSSGKRLHGSMVTFHLASESKDAAARFIAAIQGEIPFCPSLGEVSTTLSHPASTSHRALSTEQQAALGITPQTIRLSIGIESTDSILEALQRGLTAAN